MVHYAIMMGVCVRESPAEAKERTRTAREAGPEPGALDEAGTERVVASGRLVGARRPQHSPERRRGLFPGARSGAFSGCGVGAAGGDPSAHRQGRGSALEEWGRTDTAGADAA